MKKIRKFEKPYFLTAAKESPDALYFVTKDRQIIFWNQKAEEITGFKKEEVLNAYCFDNILDHTDEKGKNLCTTSCPLVEAINTKKPVKARLFLKNKIGSRIPVNIEAIPVFDDSGNTIGAIEYFFEDYGLKQIREKIRQLEAKAYIDPLTGIPNRRMLEKSLSKYLKEYRQTKNAFSLLFIDIDGFKKINDELGHLYGDIALKSIAKTLISNLKPIDLAGRFGGDEFVVILANTNEKELKKFCKKLSVIISSSTIRHGNIEFKISASLGGTTIKPDDTKKSILQRADSLMLLAKKSGKNKCLCS